MSFYRRVRGLRGSLPTGVVVGRKSAGQGAAEMLTIRDIASQIGSTGGVPGAGGGGSIGAGSDGQVYGTQSGVAGWTFLSALTSVGTLVTGVWHATKIGLLYGGTNADLTGTGGSGQVLKQDSSGGNVTVGLITILGTIVTGIWNGTKIGLLYGGTNADLTGTGGTSQVLKQTSAGAAVTVGQLAASDLSNGTTGSGSVVLAASPALSGHPTGVTESPGDNTTRLASTAFVTAAVAAGGGSTTLAGDTDVSLSGLADNDLLRYQTSDSKWHNVAKNTYSALITVLGTIATGVWRGTKVELAYGGTNADLSATGGSGQVLKQDSSSGNVTVGLITILGTIVTGVWNATKIGLAYGGTNADLTLTGGASQVLKQTSVGGAVTVGQLAASDLSNGTTGSGAVVLATSPALLTTPTAPTAAAGTNTTQIATTAFVTSAVSGVTASDWDDALYGGYGDSGWGEGGWGDQWPGYEHPGDTGQVWISRGANVALPPEWGWYTPHTKSSTFGNPAATSSTTPVHMGLAGSFTPSQSGTLEITSIFSMSGTAGGDHPAVQLAYGTGSAPANGAAQTGTLIGNLSDSLQSAANQTIPGICEAILTGLTPGTAYWFDLCVYRAGGSGSQSIFNPAINWTEY